jgi:D-glycero-D-manno-heptose 1,7-bisphosphate phosphatase
VKTAAAKALFFDRDGTLIVHKHYLADPAGVELLPGVKETLHRALAAGWRLYLFTNQSGVARGFYTMAQVETCNARMLELLALPAPGFSGICIAPESPDEPAVYRKPSPRYILERITADGLDPASCWMVGNNLSDVQAGLNAGIPAALVHPERDGMAPPGVGTFRDVADFYRRLSL